MGFKSWLCSLFGHKVRRLVLHAPPPCRNFTNCDRCGESVEFRIEGRKTIILGTEEEFRREEGIE